MKRSLFLTFTLLALIMSTGACTVKRTFYVGESYPPNPDPASVRLFIGELETPHSEIAWVHSRSANNKRVQTRREMVADLQKRAARTGADAIMDVQLLAEEHRGITVNPATPIRTPMQGEFKRYFLRGTAVKLSGDVDAVVSAPAPIDDEMLEAIPEVEPPSPPAQTDSRRAAY